MRIAAGVLLLAGAADAFLTPSGALWTRPGHDRSGASCAITRTAMGPFDFLPKFGQGGDFLPNFGQGKPAKAAKVKFGELEVSEMGLGTWSW